MVGFEEYRTCLKQILGGSDLVNTFEFENDVKNTEAKVNIAIINLRLYINQGSWTKNKYQRFVMLNVYKTSIEISRAYLERDYKDSSTRTIRTDGINKLMHYIPLEYLKSFTSRSDNSKADYALQIKACEYLHYLAKENLSFTDFSVEYKKLFQFSSLEVAPCNLSDCKKEIEFISLFYTGYVNLAKYLDESKLVYINSLIDAGVSSEIDADAVLILTELAKQIRKKSKEITDYAE